MGFRQQCAAEKAVEADIPASKLASQLLQKWAWGLMSAPDVQSVADSAFQDGLTHPQVEQLAKIGGRGKHPGNMHRDLVLITGMPNVLSDATSKVSVRLALQGKNKASTEVPLDIILPHKLFAALYHNLPNAFESSILGGEEANIARFWNAMQSHPIVTSRPQLRNRLDLRKVIPIFIHGDGVQYMQIKRAGSKSLEVLSWASLLAKGPTRVSSFLMFCIVKSAVKDWGLFQTWGKVWQVLCWSLKALSSGLWPLKDWDNKEFDPSSLDYAKKGTPLANGFAAVVFVLRSDLEFLASHFGLNSPSSNSPCALCRADRSLDGSPWTDCRLSAAWRSTCWSPTEWAAEHPNPHLFFQMEGSGIDLVFPDLMHSKHLGTDQLVIGSAITFLIKHYLPGTVGANLETVWSFMQKWFKEADWGRHIGQRC